MATIACSPATLSQLEAGSNLRVFAPSWMLRRRLNIFLKFQTKLDAEIFPDDTSDFRDFEIGNCEN